MLIEKKENLHARDQLHFCRLNSANRIVHKNDGQHSGVGAQGQSKWGRVQLEVGQSMPAANSTKTIARLLLETNPFGACLPGPFSVVFKEDSVAGGDEHGPVVGDGNSCLVARINIYFWNKVEDEFDEPCQGQL
jgi:hypothetical protein